MDAVVAKWDSQVLKVRPENQEWADEMCCQVPGHKSRHGKKFVVRGSWAWEKGLVQAGKDDSIDLYDEKAIDELFKGTEDEGCKCMFRYTNNLRDLPDGMITEVGKKKIKEMDEMWKKSGL